VADPEPEVVLEGEDALLEALRRRQDEEDEALDDDDTWAVNKLEDVFVPANNQNADDDFVDVFQKMGTSKQQQFFELLAPQHTPGSPRVASFVPTFDADSAGTSGGRFITSCRENNNVVFPIRKEGRNDFVRRENLKKRVEDQKATDFTDHSKITYPWNTAENRKHNFAGHDKPQTFQALKHMDYSNYGLGDKGIVSLAAYLRNNPIRFGSLLLKNNRMKGRGSVALMDALKGNTCLAKLDLSKNKMHMVAIETLSACLLCNSPPLVDLILQDMSLGDVMAKKIIRASYRSKTLQHLNLRGNKITTCGRVIGELIETNTSLLYLDLGWNRLTKGEASLVADPIKHNTTIKVLNLAHNAFGHGTGASTLAMALKDNSNSTLEMLDMSYNQIGEASCLVLSHALATNDSLKRLHLDGNPLGHLGCRALLQLMTEVGDEPRDVTFENCNLDVCDPSLFNEDEPNGTYSLNLSKPYGQMVVHRLAICSQRETPCWRGVTLNNKPVKKEEISGWLSNSGNIPTEGRLKCTFISLSSKKYEQDKTKIANFKKVLKRQGSRSKFGSEKLQAKLISSAAEIFTFDSEEAGELIDSFHDTGKKVEAACEMYIDQHDTHSTEDILSSLSYIERKMAETQLGTFYHFNSRNPTGSYKLSLSTRLERLVANRLIDTNADERHRNIMTNAGDKSQHGNQQMIRNGVYNGIPFVFSGDWELPSTGILEFDYVSTERPPSDCVPMTDDELYGKGMTREILDKFYEEFQKADSDGSGQIDVTELKGILQATGFHLTPQELEEFATQVDEDGSGEINMHEFLPVYKEMVNNRNGDHGVLDKFHEEFNKADSDGSGQIDVAELKGILQATGFHLTPKELEATIARADEDGSGEISMHEFLPIYEEMVNAKNDKAGFWQTYVRPEITKDILDQVAAAFKMADSDDSGQISVPELKGILQSTGFNLTPKELAVFIVRADEDGSGEINMVEFLPIYKELVTDLQMSGRLRQLRRMSTYHYFTAKQAAHMIEDFDNSLQRQELFTFLYPRVEDEENLDLMLKVLRKNEKLALDHKMGSLSLFNPMKPDGFYGRLDLSHHDCHLVAHCLIKLAVAEPGDNWLGETLDELKGAGPKEFDLNLNWVKNGPPRHGILALTYYTPPGCERYDFRKEIAEEVLGWEFGDHENAGEEDEESSAI